MTVSIEDLGRRLEAIGQGHLIAAARRLPDRERWTLFAELSELDLDLVERLARAARQPEVHAAAALEPAPVVAPHREPHLSGEMQDARALGERLRREGKVAYVLVAGGQATRLGIDAPKGTFPIGPVSSRTLFEIHADRLRALAKRGGRTPLWFVLTSPMNHDATLTFFAERRWLGLPRDRIVFVPQATVPAFDREGKLVLETRARLFRNPNGHGGVLLALAESGFLARCREEGVEHLFYWQVDNPLVRLGEPLFLGLHARAGAGMSSKVVEKRDPAEKVGVLARANGKTVCVEYSDLAPDLRAARDASGRLAYAAGNIAIHLLDVGFVEGLTRGGLRLPWHRAEKKIRAHRDGATEEVAGVKFETFVFDALAASDRTVTLEVKRESEFAPVKNAEGEDSPATARDAMRRSFSKWFREAGVDVGEAADVEVHPLFAFDSAEFASKLAAVPTPIRTPLYLAPPP
ncbi:MAG TPA: UTP--glucose-1-phosphate uridylyltransferase [Planctomycetota bacterium]|nr:UTP--glucose-1-phosphate uridylyltransferase [Planctomycetota bacterium]